MFHSFPSFFRIYTIKKVVEKSKDFSTTFFIFETSMEVVHSSKRNN